MSEESKSMVEGMVEAQEKVFQSWKEAVEEYNNTKVLEMFGEDTRNAWQNCLELQERTFSLWKEAVLQFQPFVVQAPASDLVLQNYRRWWELQQEMARSWKESASPSSMLELFNLQNWTSPDKMMRFYRQWMQAMQQSFGSSSPKQPVSKRKEN